MLSINDLKIGTIFIFENQPYQVLEFKHVHLGRGGSSLQTKIKNLISGKILAKVFKPLDSFEEAEIDWRELKYIYNHRGEFWFCEPEDPSKRTMLEESALGEERRFLKKDTLVRAMIFNNEIVGIDLPVKMDLRVVEAPPGIKGNSAQGGTKIIVLETGAEIKAPLFIEEGDIVRINTKTGEYAERVEKGR
ncbi:MAG: elongation factor P [Parcubacteria group bacterium CG08_land_8_20_14_0_20_43_9]|nr:MAG: elongation factor P [Parcubacteria group bacterium CG08_land_8_20_14_0_20_43_9]